jgi:hypothetical protein
MMFLCLVLAALDAAIAWRSVQWLPLAALIILVAVAFLLPTDPGVDRLYFRKGGFEYTW